MSIQRFMLAEDSSYATPYYVVKGKKSGPNMMIVAGIHGDELGSILAAQKLVHSFQAKQMHIHKGTLIIVPIVNKRAYLKRKRGDSVDLNRTFPQTSAQSAKHPLSSALFQLAKRYKPTWYLDLHEANGLSQKNPKRLGQTLITNPGNRCVPKLRYIINRMNSSIENRSHHFNIRLREKKGSSRTAVARILKAQAVTVETCWSLNRTLRVNYQYEIITRFLTKSGLL
ncbi:succinylglutamate desuccinylase/aspartoacylase family protein [Paenibacillus sp. FSL K6-2524]|uniref:succinylglutamate desuccinylase/aspartoacylase family protein n=1 Tax=Paenibacillus sp. FSL K6-2524 TaxID=2954516 RepID=UPI0030FB3967